MTSKQKEVLRFLGTVSEASLDQIYANVSFSYYANSSKHLGTLMKRLIDLNKVERVKKGIFKIKTHYTPTDQPQLFL